MGVISNGLNLLGVSAYFQQVIKGALIIAAVLLDSLRKGNDGTERNASILQRQRREEQHSSGLPHRRPAGCNRRAWRKVGGSPTTVSNPKMEE